MQTSILKRIYSVLQQFSWSVCVCVNWVEDPFYCHEQNNLSAFKQFAI